MGEAKRRPRIRRPERFRCPRCKDGDMVDGFDHASGHPVLLCPKCNHWVWRMEWVLDLLAKEGRQVIAERDSDE